MSERLGAVLSGDGRGSFLVWAPSAGSVQLVLTVAAAPRTIPMEAAGRGYHHLEVEGLEPGLPYRYRLDGERELPDPASRRQPDGVHGPSALFDPNAFGWSDAGWAGRPLPQYVIYELHVGTFTPEGTFDAAIGLLDRLADLGVTAIEVMPVSPFPGTRNWGYDGVFPYAVQESYGGPAGLQRLVDACHARGLAVVLDVVYNHLGPEGNVLREYGPYFTDRYRTPWGEAVNLDGAWSDEVRRYFLGTARQWFEDFHLDALRLDAIHGIVDISARPFLRELAEQTDELSARLGRRLHLIAESDLGDPRVIRPIELGGMGMDAQWADGVHHGIHSLVTGELDGYYADFGTVGHLASALRDGYAYTGQYSAFRKRRHGDSTAGISAHRFVVCVQNHDQIGNRMRGDRLSTLVPPEGLRLAAGLLLLSPFVPLLFMGEEYGETAPFPYFVSHTDPELVRAVRSGRREEFAAFAWGGEPPDPQSEDTFMSAKLHHERRGEEPHRRIEALYRDLLRLRREVAALARLSREHQEVAEHEEERVLVVRRWSEDDEALAVFNFGEAITVTPSWPGAPWTRRLDSSDHTYGGGGATVPETLGPFQAMTLAASSFVLLTRPRPPAQEAS